MRFDRDKFFDGYRDAFGAPRQQQVDGLNFLLDRIEQDPHITQIVWAGYMLSTVRRETAYTFQPIHEYGGHAYFVRRYGGQTRKGRELGNLTPEDGALFSGEGDVQLTGRRNFQKATAALKSDYPEIVAAFEARTGQLFDLVKNPSQAGDPAIAYAIMSFGMRTGMFTGKKLSDYNLRTKAGRVGARRIINGQDHALEFAADAATFTDILTGALIDTAIDPPRPETDDSIAELPTTNEPPQPADTQGAPATLVGEPETQSPSIMERFSTWQQKADSLQDRVSSSSVLTTITTKAGGWSALIIGFVMKNPVYVVAGLVLIVAAIAYFSRSKDRVNARVIAAPPTPVTAEINV